MIVAFVTFGCRLNHAEALDLEARFAAAGHVVVNLDDGIPPDAIVVRGCSVTAKAQHDCEKAILRLQRRHPSAQIIPMGCLPQAIPLPDTFLPSATAENARPPVPLRTSRAYLKIQDGCTCNCAFCIVPRFRGPSVSVPFDQVIARAEAFLDAGFHELVVTGCNLALYRSTGRNGVARLPDVLAALATLRGGHGHRVRLGSLEPGICDAGLLDAFEAHPNICRFIHLSLQSASDAVLARMNRPYRIAAVEAFCAEARRRLGRHLAFGCDALAGFPGETADDHQQTCAFLTRHAFTNVHAFPYSERPGTVGATLPDALPRNLRLHRARALDALGRHQRAAFAQTFLGHDVEVCVEKDGNGWTGEYLPCCLPPGATRRTLVRVRVESVTDDTLVAQ